MSQLQGLWACPFVFRSSGVEWPLINYGDLAMGQQWAIAKNSTFDCRRVQISLRGLEIDGDFVHSVALSGNHRVFWMQMVLSPHWTAREEVYHWPCAQVARYPFPNTSALQQVPLVLTLRWLLKAARKGLAVDLVVVRLEDWRSLL